MGCAVGLESEGRGRDLVGGTEDALPQELPAVVAPAGGGKRVGGGREP
ncbi:hypothetical protein AB0903_31880 [Streptomyces sp. NPDC048389]